MKIVVAKTAGFCMGVRRAVELALDAPSQQKQPIYTYGPLIHNPQVLGMFTERGVTVLEEIPRQANGTVLVRAHGVPPETKQLLKEAGFAVIDATCPKVVKVQSIIKSHARKDFSVVIVGDQDHPEVVSLLGFAGEKGWVVGSLAALQALPAFEQAIVVAQTTQNQLLYQQVKSWVAEHHSNYKVFDTICDSTERRQTEVRRLAQEVDAVVVVGGKNSGNTRRLADIVVEAGKPAFHIETEAELDLEALRNIQTVGITAGASTPTWIIKRVVRALEQMPIHRRDGIRSLLPRLMRLALLTNLYVAFGAGCLSYAAMLLQKLPTSWPAVGVAMLYVLSMHILNHLTSRAEDRYNDPDRERFYRQHKIVLTAMALSAGALGLVTASQLGVVPFWTLFVMSLLGLSYNLRLLPASMCPTCRYRRIRDLPGSKTILIALAWGVVTAGLPALTSSNWQWGVAGLAVFWASATAFGRTAFFDLLDIQGDRIVGKETIPILLGAERGLLLLKIVLGALLIVLIATGWSGLFSPLAFWLTLCPICLWAIIGLHEHRGMLAGMQLEFMVESLFVLTGIVAFVWVLAAV